MQNNRTKVLTIFSIVAIFSVTTIFGITTRQAAYAMPYAGSASVRYQSTRNPNANNYRSYPESNTGDTHSPYDYQPPSNPIDLQPGDRVATLPLNHVSVEVEGRMIHYYRGFFLKQSGSSFEVITPPVGMIVPELPPLCSRVSYQGESYNYCKGAFFYTEEDGHRVIDAPVGAVVTHIPSNARRIVVNAVAHYLVAGTLFRPMFYQGSLVYQVVPPI